MINVAICDDDKNVREYIKKMIEVQKIECKILEYESGNGLIETDEKLDIVFLDIKMDGIDGIRAAEILREKQMKNGWNENIILIFITAMKQYVFKAFEVFAFNFLLKPIEDKKLIEVFSRAVKECQRLKEHNENKIFVKTRYINRMLNVNEILYVESQRRKVDIYTKEEKLEIYAKMDELEKELGSGFFRCHRGYLVNMAYIMEYDTESIKLKNGKTVYMAKQKYNSFVKAFMHYLRSGGVSYV